ncbi:MAG: hypothetical protein HXY35_14280 [Chloroflexi bacterium]|nr:hypothetical protein [Chloroflexota bacterium]
MNQTMKRILFSMTATLVLLSACAPAAAPTQDPALVQQLIEQSVQLTVAAQNAETASAIPPATETPLPTATEAAVEPTAIPAIPSATPFVVVPPTAVVSGGGVTTTKPEYACDVVHQRPFDDTVYKPGEKFDVKWTIVNTGTKPWRAGLDLKYSYGPVMMSTTTIELPAMDPGDQFDVDFDAVAPMETGHQVMVWLVEGQLCYPYVRIIVEK